MMMLFFLKILERILKCFKTLKLLILLLGFLHLYFFMGFEVMFKL